MQNQSQKPAQKKAITLTSGIFHCYLWMKYSLWIFQWYISSFHWGLHTNEWVEVTQSCPTLRYPMDCNPPGSSIHGLLQNGLPFPSPGGLPDQGIEPRSPGLQADFFITWTTTNMTFSRVLWLSKFKWYVLLIFIFIICFS